MAFWEFLIQKEGDRSWLPLESPTVEILEGRYRVVARSSRIHTPVEIRVIQNATAETPPVRRIQKRLSQTNQDGLMVVIPFTRLAPGEWELRCGGDVMSDMMGEGWLYRVQLQVLPIDLEVDDTLDDWEPEWHKESTIALAEAAPAALSHSQPESQPEPQPEPLPVGKPEEDKPFSAPAADPPLLQLSLEQATYVVQRGLPLVLSGQVLGGQILGGQALGEENQFLEEPAISGGKLRVRLFDPQTSQMLVDETQLLTSVSLSQSPLSARSLPLAFSITLALPSDCETHLLLGELALYGVAEKGLPPVLATQSFSVTTDLLELLEAIANDFTEPEPEAAKPVAPSVTVPAPFIQFRPALQQPLPPLLHLPGPEKETRRSLQLPTLTDSAAGTETENAAHEVGEPGVSELGSQESRSQESGVAEPGVTKPEVAESGVAEPEALSNPLPNLQPQLELVDEAGDPAIDWQRAEPHMPLWQKQSSLPDLSPDQPQTPEDSAFRALNLQEKFLERLQALATDPELADWLSAMTAPESADPERHDGSSPTVETGVFVRRSQDRAIGLDAELAAQEIVVDEPFFTGDRPQVARQSTHSSNHPAANQSVAASAAATTVLALSEEPLATPQLDVPPGELVAGQTIDIVVKIPDTYGRISVKLWTHDRQSRTLLDGPHWLMDFSPDGFGNLVGKTQIMVPFGCVEVQLEAIAIDITTQVESDKVSVIRSVIPPDLTAMSAVF